LQFGQIICLKTFWYQYDCLPNIIFLILSIFLRFYTTDIKLFFKLTSFKFDKISMFYIFVISLCDKFKILKFCNAAIPSILEILLLCKSKTYNFPSSVIPRILLIWFLGKSNTFSVGRAKFYISLIWLS
jgi:hypothetical protein